jgi:hypothetical protein
MTLFEKISGKGKKEAERKKRYDARRLAYEEVKPMVVNILERLGKDLYGRSLLSRKRKYAILEYDSMCRLSLQWRPKEIVPFPVLDITFQNFQHSFENIHIFNPRNQSSVTIPVDQVELEAALERIAPSLYQ